MKKDKSEYYNYDLHTNIITSETVHMNLAFSMEGGSKYNGNLSIAEFMEKMKKNIELNVPPVEYELHE